MWTRLRYIVFVTYYYTFIMPYCVFHDVLLDVLYALLHSRHCVYDVILRTRRHDALLHSWHLMRSWRLFAFMTSYYVHDVILHFDLMLCSLRHITFMTSHCVHYVHDALLRSWRIIVRSLFITSCINDILLRIRACLPFPSWFISDIRTTTKPRRASWYVQTLPPTRHRT